MDNGRDVQLSAADTLLERGVRFRLPASLLSRLLGRDWVTIRPLKLGTILEICRVSIEEGIDDVLKIYSSDAETIAKIAPACARCIAIAALNDKKKIERGVDKLTERLTWYVDAKCIVDIYMIVKSMWRVQDFMSITALMCQMTQMMMTPRIGQEAKGR